MRVRGVLALATVALLSAALVGFAPLRTPSANATATAPTPVVSGNKILDSRTGSVFVPHGANWPSFEYACSEGWGYSQDDDNNASAAAMVSWGINIIRIPLNEECWLGLSSHDYGGTDYTGYRAAVAAWVGILHAHGIAVILDLHWSAPTNHRATGQWPMADHANSPAFWTSVASTYKNDPSVIFDLFNEPYSIYGGYQLSWACWQNGGSTCKAPYVDDNQEAVTGSGAGTYQIAGMQELVTAVRNAGADQPIMLGGLNYSNDLSGWLAHEPTDPLAQPQLIASWHNYPGQDDCGYNAGCWDTATSTVHASVPIITGEFGETDGHSTDLVAYMNWADSKGIGYLPWAWWDGSGLTDDARLYALYTGPNFTPLAPEGTAYKAHLANLPPMSTRPIVSRTNNFAPPHTRVITGPLTSSRPLAPITIAARETAVVRIAAGEISPAASRP